MALGNCISCGGTVSSAAPTCPHCGQPSPIGPALDPRNPFRPPVAEPAPAPAATASADLRAIAVNQKGVLWCILGGFAAGVTATVMKDSPLAIFAGLAYIGVVIASVVYVYRLAAALHGTTAGVVLALLTLVPCLGLVVLLVLSQQAIGRLQTAGIKVGLMGADLTQFNT